MKVRKLPTNKVGKNEAAVATHIDAHLDTAFNTRALKDDIVPIPSTPVPCIPRERLQCCARRSPTNVKTVLTRRRSRLGTGDDICAVRVPGSLERGKFRRVDIHCADGGDGSGRLVECRERTGERCCQEANSSCTNNQNSQWTDVGGGEGRECGGEVRI